MDNLTDINQQKEESVDYKALFFKFYRYWYFFIITIFIALLIAFLFNKYTKPIYKVTTTVLVQDEKKNATMDPSSFMEGFGLFSSKKNLENEIGVLKSYTLTSRAVKELNFNVSYYAEDNFITRELYKESPITVILDSIQPQAINLRFNITFISNQKYKLEVDGENVDLYDFREYKKITDKKIEKISLNQTYNFGDQVVSKYFKFKVVLNDNYLKHTLTSKRMSFVFNDLESLVSEFKNFSIEPINKEATVIEISLKGSNITKSVDFLNKLASVYINRGLERKNQIAINTILFIDDQLKGMTDSLTSTEKSLQSFRTQNVVMDFDYQTQKVVDYMKELQDQKAELVVKGKYYDYLKNYLSKKSEKIDDLLVPSAMGIEDPSLGQMILELTKTYDERSEMLAQSSTKNPYIKALDQKINSTKSTILENIKNIVNTSNIAIKDIDGRINTLTAEINKMPGTQRQLLGIQRKYKLNDEIYTYLMQKRSEAAIAKASNLPDNEIIDQAKAGDKSEPVFPKKSLNYIIALILGIVLPILYILGKDYFNDTVVERKDIEDITKVPILGHIIHNTKESKIVVAESPKSSIAESFRSVRTNLQFVTKGKEKVTILVTSDMVSEGKTFTSMNLATIFALYGKKTLLMGFDLRKPKIYQDFRLTNTEGISSFLINKSKFENIVQVSPIENLDIMG